MKSNITKLNISHFLFGLTFWWGIEKLFLKSIGLDAVGMAVVTACYGFVLLALDIPGGMLADRWSRRGTLLVAGLFGVASSMVLGTSHGLPQYLVGAVLYGVFWAGSNGTYQALMYDTLHQLGRPAEYSKQMGVMYLWYCIGAGVADAASGYIAQLWGYPTDYWLTTAVGVINLAVMWTIAEPRYHKPGAKEQALAGLRDVLKELWTLPLLRSLLLVSVVMAGYDAFKSDLSQLYMLLYVSSPVALGWLWSIFAFVAAAGYYVAHRLHGHVNAVIIAVVVGVVLMAAFDHPTSIVWFMAVVLVAVILSLQIETRIQEAVPAHVRVSVFSVISMLGRVVSMAVVLGLGWLTNHYGAFAMVQWLAVVMVALLGYWLVVGRPRLATSRSR